MVRVRQWGESLDRLDDSSIQNILDKMDGKSIALLGCAGKIWKNRTEDENLWERVCFKELRLDILVDPLGNACPTFKSAYVAFRVTFELYPWKLVTRARGCWDGIRKWLTDHFIRALDTLQNGASEGELDELQTILGVKLPQAMRILYRVYNGQMIEDEEDPDIDGRPLGLIGVYNYYGNNVNVYLLPVQQIIQETRSRRRLRENHILIAKSSTATPKEFFLNCENGQVYVATRNFEMNREILECVPREAIKYKDGMLVWLEEHNRRLQSGVIATRGDGNRRSISLYPQQAPLCSTNITQGIQVRASAVLVPELSDPPNAVDKYFYVFSVRMSLVPNITFESCQLSTRRWYHYIRGGLSQVFEGKGVVGEFPILSRTSDEFVYESWASLSDSPGSMDGSYTFMPGCISRSTGNSFEVGVAEFPLQLPDYIF